MIHNDEIGFIQLKNIVKLGYPALDSAFFFCQILPGSYKITFSITDGASGSSVVTEVRNSFLIL